MSKPVTPDHTVIVNHMLLSFHQWAKTCSRKSIYKKIPPHYEEIIRDAFVEMPKPEPGVFDTWYVKNHMRYSMRKRKNSSGTAVFREEEKRFVRELMHNYLSDLCRGKVEANR